MFINDVMEEECLRKCEINPSFQNRNLNIKIKLKIHENIKILHIQKKIGSHMVEFLMWGLFSCE